jgi:cytochrome c-type biogenesis protein CcmH/NrfG
MGAKSAWLADMDPSPILIGAGILIVIVIIGATAVLWTRRRMRGNDADIADVPAAGFTLGDLKRLHQAGQISNEEFEKARATVVMATKRAAERMAAAKNPAPRKPPLAKEPFSDR